MWRVLKNVFVKAMNGFLETRNMCLKCLGSEMHRIAAWPVWLGSSDSPRRVFWVRHRKKDYPHPLKPANIRQISHKPSERRYTFLGQTLMPVAVFAAPEHRHDYR
jgi:hypothetical protein